MVEVGGGGEKREVIHMVVVLLLHPWVTHQHSGRYKSEAWVLHSSIGKGGREDEKVIGTPDVRTNNLFSCCQHSTSLYGKKYSIPPTKKVQFQGLKK